MSLDKETVVEYLSNLPVIELAEMISTLEEKWGVSAAAPVAVAGVAAAAGGAPAEEKTEFDVILSEIDASKKINVIKEVRAVTGLGLKEAKDLVEGAPKPVKEGVSKDEAAKIKDVLEKAGAKVTVK